MHWVIINMTIRYTINNNLFYVPIDMHVAIPITNAEGLPQ
jgi:hypothetical protein